MKKKSKTAEIIEYFIKNPGAHVATVAKKSKLHISHVYALRKRAAQEGESEVDAVPQPVPTESVDAVLDSRGGEYGKFVDGAGLMQSIKRLLAAHAEKHDKTFADDQWEALEMIVHKMGRIVNGNPNKIDHWVDIAGYATLVADRLNGNPR